MQLGTDRIVPFNTKDEVDNFDSDVPSRLAGNGCSYQRNRFVAAFFFRDNQRRSDGLLDYKSTEWNTKAFYLQFPPCDTIWRQVRRKGNHLSSFSIWLGKLANVGSSPSKRQQVSLDAIREATGRSCCQFPIQLLCVTNPILCPVGKTKFAVSSAGTAVDPLVIYGRLKDFVGVSISSIVRLCQLQYLRKRWIQSNFPLPSESPLPRQDWCWWTRSLRSYSSWLSHQKIQGINVIFLHSLGTQVDNKSN